MNINFTTAVNRTHWARHTAPVHSIQQQS